MGNRRQFLGMVAVAGLYSVIPATVNGADRAVGQQRVMSETRHPGNTASPLTLFLCGDVMTGRGIDQILPHPCDPRLYEPYVKDAREYVALAEAAHGPISTPVDFAYVWGDASAELSRLGPDLRLINLETAVTTSRHYEPKGINYRMNPANIDCLKVAAPDCCVLANNHVLDWGRTGLAETLATLDKAGLAHAGAGLDRDMASAPRVLPVPGKGRVLVFAFGDRSSGIPDDWGAQPGHAGVNLLPDLSTDTVDAIAAQVVGARQPGDVVVASIHWGGNWGYGVPAQQRAFAHGLIERAGVDLVHGHSSHHVKGIEVHRERLILYGCGDLLTDYEGIHGYEDYRDDLGLMYFPRVEPGSGRLLGLAMSPTRLRRLRINRVSAEEVAWLAGVLNHEGRSFGTRVSLDEDGRLQLHWQGGKG